MDGISKHQMVDSGIVIAGRPTNSSVVLSILSKEVPLTVSPATTVQEVVVGSLLVESTVTIDRLTKNVFVLTAPNGDDSQGIVLLLSGYRAFTVQNVKLGRKRSSTKATQVTGSETVPIELRRFFKFANEQTDSGNVPEDEDEAFDIEEMFRNRNFQRNVVGSLIVSPIRLQLGQVA